MSRKKWVKQHYFAHTGEVTSWSVYADDTYLIVPASNVDSRSLELENIEQWAKGSNLTLNRSKTVEIMITDGRKKKRANHHRYQTSAAHLISRFSVSPSQTICQRTHHQHHQQVLTNSVCIDNTSSSRPV